MLNHQTLNTLRSLKLTGMADGLEQQQAQPGTHEELGFEERLALLVDRESMHRNNNKISRLLKVAKLKLQASPEDIDYRHPRGLKQSQFADLLSSHWCINTIMCCSLDQRGAEKRIWVVFWRRKHAGTVCQCVTSAPHDYWSH